MTLEELYQIIKDRKKNMPKDSYTASLFREGKDRIIQKVGEESTEVIIAAKNNNSRALITEIADLYFRLVVLIVSKNISLKEIEAELDNRNRKK